MRAVGRTDVGNLRTNNEDAFFVSPDPVGSLPNLFVVADGMGGHKAGEVASQNALAAFLEYIGSHPCDDGERLDCLTGAVSYANGKVYEQSLTNFDYYGMGTTFSACVVENERVYIAHIGDSRIYLVSGGTVTQLTNDHTYVGEMVRAGQFSREEAARHPNKNALTRALGVERGVPADARIDHVKTGDILLLCSDGLTNMVPDDEMNGILTADAELSVKADRLIDAAKEHGGADNITVIVAEID